MEFNWRLKGYSKREVMFSAVYQVIDMNCFKFPVSTSRSFWASMPDGALYESLILYVLPASVHHTVVNVFKDIILNPLHHVLFLEYKATVTEGLIFN
jgi:hypothetical protein